MIVDTPGFQNPEQGGSARGACFEELCHNYAQDRLQKLFHERTFVQELERYKEVAFALSAHRAPLAAAPQGGFVWCGGGPASPAACLPVPAPSSFLSCALWSGGHVAPWA